MPKIDTRGTPKKPRPLLLYALRHSGAPGGSRPSIRSFVSDVRAPPRDIQVLDALVDVFLNDLGIRRLKVRIARRGIVNLGRDGVVLRSVGRWLGARKSL